MKRFTTRRPLATACLALAACGGAQAGSNVITVGIAGLSNNCTVSTVQAAIDEARRRGGHQVVWITRNVAGGSWTNQRLNITDQDVDLVGGFDDCNDITPSDYTYLSGVGGTAAPVLRIRGGGVISIKGLAFVGGDASAGGDAGGIDYQGRGSLNLEETVVLSNSATGHDVGGVDFEGSGGQAFLTLLNGVSISENAKAGLRVSGTATLTMTGERNFIWNNGTAGLLIAHPAQAFIGAASFDNRGVFHRNGGPGIVASTNGSGTGTAFVKLYSADVWRPLGFTANAGPAIVVNSRDAGASRMTVCAKNIRIADHIVALNTVPNNNGNLISVEGQGAHFALNTECDYPPDAGQQCAPLGQTFCNLLQDNSVTGGRALVGAVDGGSAEVHNVRVTGNNAPYILQTVQAAGMADSQIDAKNLLIDQNNVILNLINVNPGGVFVGSNLTLTHNSGKFFSLRSEVPTFFSLSASIVNQEQPLLTMSGNPLLTQLLGVLAPNGIGVRPGHVLVLGSPSYLPGTFQLSPFSLGIDYAPAAGGSDIDGRPRDVDDPFTPNHEGPRDLGAFETQVLGSDRIFASGFQPL